MESHAVLIAQIADLRKQLEEAQSSDTWKLNIEMAKRADAIAARAEKAEQALAEREKEIAELREERDEYFQVIGHSRTIAFREKLAALCHEQWSGWMKYLFSKCLPAWDEPKASVIPAWGVERWMRQMNTPYADLSHEEKESDRKEADRFLALLSPTPNPTQQEEP